MPTYRRYKKKRAKKTYKRLACAPILDNLDNISPETCLTKSVLLQLKRDFNKDHPKDQILSTKPILIWRELKSRLDECTDDRCLLKEIDDVSQRNKVMQSLFAPNHPPSWLKNKNEWLSNIDIDKVMAQYQQRYRDFAYLGTTSIDYDFVYSDGHCVEDKLCKFNLQDLYNKGKRRFASVFNLDPHTESGSHWVSMFINMDKKSIVFFDSAKGGLPEEIIRFRDSVIKQGKQMKPAIDFVFYTNDADHQQGNTECGVYSIYFIVEMLRDHGNLQKFMKGNITDALMESQRQRFFNAPQ
jgi:hypothetical protein